MDRCLAGFLAVSENLDRLAKAKKGLVFPIPTQIQEFFRYMSHISFSLMARSLSAITGAQRVISGVSDRKFDLLQINTVAKA